MARKRRLNENKKNIIASLIEEYGIQTAADVQEALKDLLGGTIQEMMERWVDNRDVVSPIFKSSETVRKIIYTTNAIESLNGAYRTPLPILSICYSIPPLSAHVFLRFQDYHQASNHR